RNPEHAASMSNAAAFFAPIFCWMRHAVAGKGMSGVIVAQIMRSISSSRTPACSIARRDASAPMSDVHIVSEAIRRSRIPERVTIHSSVVSTIFSKSALVRIRSGRYEPVPTMWTDLRGCFDLGLCNCVLLDFVMKPFDVLNDMLVELAFDKLGGHSDGILYSLR